MQAKAKEKRNRSSHLEVSKTKRGPLCSGDTCHSEPQTRASSEVGGAYRALPPRFGAEAPTAQRGQVCGLRVHSEAEAEVRKASLTVPARLVG